MTAEVEHAERSCAQAHPEEMIRAQFCRMRSSNAAVAPLLGRQ
jgi:hypothetical protein